MNNPGFEFFWRGLVKTRDMDRLIISKNIGRYVKTNWIIIEN
jgi:hypothetical protein